MIKKAVISSKLSEHATEYLKNTGFDIITFRDNPNVDKRVAYHADLSLFYDGIDTLFIANEMSEYVDLLNKYCKNVVVINRHLKKEYPGDVLLNCVCTGRNFICNAETVSYEIFDKMKKSGYNIINVKQGYTKCSVVPVSDNAIITDDAKVMATPSLNAESLNAELIHEAAIGKIAGDQLTKLMTLGLTEDEAEAQIINGFLK